MGSLHTEKRKVIAWGAFPWKAKMSPVKGNPTPKDTWQPWRNSAFTYAAWHFTRPPPLCISNLPNPFEILHRAWQWYCHALWKISKGLGNWNRCYGWTNSCGIWVWDEFSRDILHCNCTQVPGSNALLWWFIINNTLPPYPMILTHWSLEDVAVILIVQSPSMCYRLCSWAPLVKLLSGECHGTPLRYQQIN